MEFSDPSTLMRVDWPNTNANVSVAPGGALALEEYLLHHKHKMQFLGVKLNKQADTFCHDRGRYYRSFLL